MLGDSSKCIGIGLRSAMQSEKPDRIFSGVKECLNGDVVFGNLECVLSDHDYNGLLFGKAQMRGLPSSIHAVKDAGFTVLNVANNHTLQYGATGFVNTCRILDEAGIGIVGMRGSSGFLCKPLILEINGIKLGILGYAMEKDQYYSGKTLYAQGSADEIVEDVGQLHKLCDYVVVSMHWGDEFVTMPSGETIKLARRIIDSGANAIIGHHPHVVQGIEEYNNSVIVYSLGNFVSDMIWDSALTSGIVVEIISENGTCKIEKIHRSSIDKNYNVNISNYTSLLEYHKEHSVHAKNDDTYHDEVNILRKIYRNKSHIYILKNMHRYNIIVLVQIIGNSIKSLLSNVVAKICCTRQCE